jgi:hypothetical protein
MKRTAPPRWPRVVALVILCWALLDLCVPGICPGERDSSWAPETSGFVIAHSPLSMAGTSAPSPVAPDVDDDCWCCSSHVAPAPHFELATLATVDLEDAPLFENPSQGWSQLPYRPPRS